MVAAQQQLGDHLCLLLVHQPISARFPAVERAGSFHIALVTLGHL